MPATIRIRDHISPLLNVDDSAFGEYVKRLKRRVSRANPEAVLVRRTIDMAMQGVQNARNRDDLLLHLMARDCPKTARALLCRLADALPPPCGAVTCHLLPSAGTRGSGNRFAEDRILVTVPATSDGIAWLEFVIAHEYSHIQNDYAVDTATVRDFLISEGLAMVLAETFATKPHPYPWGQVTPEQEALFWKQVDLDARGLDAYTRYLGSDVAYEAGTRVVRSYLHRHNISICEAHTRTLDELYQDSGYHYIR